jgi:hypothetical protein
VLPERPNHLRRHRHTARRLRLLLGGSTCAAPCTTVTVCRT